MFAETELNVRNKKVQSLFRVLFMLMTGLLILPVLIILATLIYKGGSVISMDFLFTAPTDGMTAGGIFPALIGTVWLVAVALLISVPIGIAAAIYLNEYAGKTGSHASSTWPLSTSPVCLPLSTRCSGWVHSLFSSASAPASWPPV